MTTHRNTAARREVARLARDHRAHVRVPDRNPDVFSGSSFGRHNPRATGKTDEISRPSGAVRQFNFELLVWEAVWLHIPQPVPPRPAVVPLGDGSGRFWQVRDRQTGCVLWTIEAGDFDRALAEKIRLCVAAGWKPGHSELWEAAGRGSWVGGSGLPDRDDASQRASNADLRAYRRMSDFLAAKRRETIRERRRAGLMGEGCGRISTR